MIDGELRTIRDTAKTNVDFLDISNKFLIDLIFSDLSFESKRVTREEVERVLNDDTQNIEEDRIQLIRNQKNAVNFIVNMVKNNEIMDENKLKDLHQAVMEGFSNIGGLYRNVDISIKGSNHTPPSHIKVYDRMKKYFDFTLTAPNNNLFEFISYCHLQLAKIHPFLDGNGRTARLVLNYQLMRYDFMPIIISAEHRNAYFDCLEEFKVNKNISSFVRFLEKLERDVLQKV